MPLRNDLLNPISPDHPAGENLWYSPLYDKIKEARREDDELKVAGDKRDRKVPDWPVAIKLMTEALATKTKDLWLGVWLAEALTRTEGITGFREAVDLIHSIIVNFWDTLYPELEDGDAEYRASPLRWLGETNAQKMIKLELAIKSSPITKNKLNWLQYGDASAVGSEAAADTYDKQQARAEALAEGRMAWEVFEKDFIGTPKSYYVDLEAAYFAALQSLDQLSETCDEKFGDVSPSFRQLREVVETVQKAVTGLLEKKREKDPDIVDVKIDTDVDTTTDLEPEAPPDVEPETQGDQKPVPKKRGKSIGAEPQDYEDAVARIAAVAKFLREQDAGSPAPYLLLRGLRWGELRAGGGTIDQLKLGAPPSEIRQELKRASIEGNWAAVLETAETAMAMECGRGWLDLQRYVVRACAELGYSYEPIRLAVISELKALLLDYPQLPEFTMMDDTATANAETVAWIKEHVVPRPPEPEPAAAAEPEPEPEATYSYYEQPPAAPESAHDGVPAAPDVFQLAVEAAQSGRAQEGLEMLMREMMQEPSGRGRFQRKIQVAQLCLGMGNEAIALPILEEAAAEIERRKLEEWESREVVAHPLAMLYRCLAKNNGAPEERQKLYSWICRLDPIEAMKVAR